MKLSKLGFVLATLGFSGSAAAGPFLSYSDPLGQVQPSGIQAWATGVVDYSPAPGVAAGFTNPLAAIGEANGTLVSLGDLDATQIADGVAPGSITLSFSTRIYDGPGADFAVFENAGTFFTDPYVFAELAYVEVSSNGVDFARFPSHSLNIEPDDNGVLDPNELDVVFGRDFAAADSTNIYNLAGVHPTGIGTPFNLSELVGDPLVVGGTVDLSSIRYVRLVDIPGNGAFLDSFGNPIVDTWLTTGPAGFDLDAVGAINTVPEPMTGMLLGGGMALLIGYGRLRRRG